MTYDLDANAMTVHVTGIFNYQAQVLQNSQPITLRDSWHIADSRVDLTKDPPAWVPKPQ
jgi:hypothetical protein